MPRPAPATPLRVHARFMGTTTILLDDGETGILIDGFFSRPTRRQLALEWIEPDPETIREALRCAAIGTLAALLVTHAHYDHALDSALVAERTGAQFIGSTSSANIALGTRLSIPIQVVGPGSRLRLGSFAVTALRTVHGTPTLFRGTIDRPLRQPAPVQAYREGGSLSFLLTHPDVSVVVHPGTDYVEGQYRGVRADVVFLSTALLTLRNEQFAERYWREVVRATGATLVIPVHWDDFNTRLSETLQPVSERAHRMALDRICTLADRDGVRVRGMQPFAPLDLRGALPASGSSPRPAATGAECSSEDPCARSCRTAAR